MMKLKARFGPETRFDPPIRRIPRTRDRWWSGLMASWRRWQWPDGQSQNGPD